jgi:photosystem II stability/assembly factor-like uncharacterized protein
MSMRAFYPVAALTLFTVSCGLQGCGGMAELRTRDRSAGRANVDGLPLRSGARGWRTTERLGRPVAGFRVTVRPDLGTMTCASDLNSGSQVHTALRQYGPADALKLTNTNVRLSNGMLTGDVKIISSHPLPLYDVKVTIEQISSSGVSVAGNGDGLLATGKPFYSYGILNPNSTSAAKTWKFSVPAGVSFTFTAYLYANVWQPSPNDGNTVNAVSFPSNTNGWAVGNGGKVLATTNGGLSWAPQNARADVDFQDVFFTDSTTGFAVGPDETIVRTTNGGREWQTVNTNPNAGGARLSSVCFVDPSRGWAVGDQGVLLTTTNGGTSWSKTTIATDLVLYCVRFVNASIGWTVGGSGTILKTINGGGSWIPQSLPGGLPFPSSFVELLGAAFSDANNGIIVGAAGLVFRTTNGGASWSRVTIPTAANLTSVVFASPSVGWIVGTRGAILKTTNGGASWALQNGTVGNGLSAGTDLMSVACVRSPQATSAWAVGHSGALLYTLSGGTTWLKSGGGIGTSAQLNATDWIDAQRGYAVGMNGTMLRTINGGQSWLSMIGAGTAHLNDVAFIDDKVGFAVGSIGTILKTTNGGQSWTPQDSHLSGQNGDPTANLYSVRFRDYQNGWVCGSRGVLASTTDGGSTWVRRPAPVSETALQMMVWTDGNNGWIVGTNGNVLRTSTGGNSWNPQSTGVPDDLYSIRMLGPDTNYTGWVVGEHGVILKTSNGGASWIRQTSGLPNTILRAVDFVDPQRGYIAGDDGVVLRTTNGGTTWARVDAGTDRSLFDLFAIDADLIWVVGQSGTIRKLN